jgi:transcription elongation factor GreB
MAGSRNTQRGRGNQAPGSPTSNYITPEGFERLRTEHENLWRVERPKVTQAVSTAAALGDRSENADYIYGKKRLREIDSRIRFLSKRLEALTVVRESPEQADKIFFGAWVTLEDEQGDQVCYRIVGPDESNPGSRAISVDSPVGRALMGRELDDEVQVKRPRGVTNYSIVEVAYREPEAK